MTSSTTTSLPPPFHPKDSVGVNVNIDDHGDDEYGTSPSCVRQLTTFLLERNSGGSNSSTTTTTTTTKEPSLVDETRIVYHTMKELVDRLPTAIQERKEQNISPGAPNDPILTLFRQTELTQQEWERFAFFDPNKPYTRNLISTDHSSYTLLLLCWNPGQESPIHDHPCDGCWLQVLKGTIQECKYHNQTLQCTSTATFTAGEIGYITDSMGYHKIGNPTHTTPAITLHLYAPPIEKCRIWYHELEPHNFSNATSSHYSEYGQVL